MTADVDVIVVGAGLAGLMAARELVKAGQDVVVFEARDRVGGRMHSVTMQNEVVEVGGRWTGPGQVSLKSLADDLGIAYGHPPRLHGGSVLVQADQRSVLQGTRVPTDVSRDEFANAVHLIDQLAATIPLESPWQAADALEWDSITAYSWLQANLAPHVTEHITNIAMDFLPHPREVSMLHALFYFQSNGGFASIVGLDREPHDSEVITGGSHQIPETITESLGDRVRLSTPITSVRQDGNGVSIFGDNIELSGRYVIIAIPGVLAGRLTYTPRDACTARLFDPANADSRQDMCRCAVFRTILAVRRPQRTGTQRHFGRLVEQRRCITCSTGYPAQHGSFNADRESIWRSPAGVYTRRVGTLLWSASKKCAGYHLRQLGSGTLQPRMQFLPATWRVDPLWQRFARTVGRIHWAGAEYSAVFVGQMEGAVRSGSCAAVEILKRLS